MNILWINKITDAECWRATQLGLTKALRKKGHNVMLVMAKNIGENKYTDENIIYFPTVSSSLLSGLFFGLVLSFYFPFFIWKKKPDVILVDGTSVWLPFTLTLKIFNIPLVMDIRTLPTKKNRDISFDLCLHLSKYMTAGLTTITPELEKILRTKYNLKDKKIGIWPSGVSLEDFAKSNNDNNTNDQMHSKNFVVMHHGSYKGSPRGVENLIKSIGKLDDSFKKSIELKIVGIPLEEQGIFLHLCEELNIEEQVKIIPQVKYDKIPSYIESSDVGVIPLATNKKCWQVSVPLKTLEYLAMGKPIIATSISFHQKIFEKGECGVLIDNNSPKALSDAITYLYQNRTKLDFMGKTGREIVKNHYTWDKAAFEVERFISTILADFRK